MKNLSESQKYIHEASLATAKEYNISNVMEYPSIKKIVINVGYGKNKGNSQMIDLIKNHLYDITGQKAVLTKAKKSISSFKLRSGENIGMKVTLRGKRMADFLYKVIHIALPSIRDFRGISLKAVDKQGNYTIGLHEHTVFPEISFSKDHLPFGLEITIVSNINDPLQVNTFYTKLGFPFIKEQHA